MALLNVGDDPWLLEHESCEKLFREIMEQLSLRQRHPKSTDKHAQLSAAIRLRLKQYNNEVNQLNQKLEQSYKITHEERERRVRQVETLQSKGIQMQKLFDDQTSTINRDRLELINAPGASHWNGGDDELISVDPAQYSVNQLRSQQKQMLENQEKGLENLSKIISRQIHIANTISSEVDLHNEIIDDLGEHIDRTDARVANETKHIGVIDRKDKTCVYWVVIILLLISIITVAAI